MKNNHNTARTRAALLQDVGELKRSAAQVAQDVREHAVAHVDETRQRVAQATSALRERMTTNPLALVGIGFVVGFLLALRIRS
jgi:ElaB/YqjD/DUF883 family membrane-anchored ribosome-binding protein